MTGSAGASGEPGPCDIYQAAGTPCVAAHSTVRALYAAYKGALYQVRRASDGSTKDVPALGAGGFADVSVQNTFCSGTKCTISILYDQSTNHNKLLKSGVAHWLPSGGTEADAAAGQITVSGHTVHGIYVTGYSTNVAYRNNATTGVPKGDQAEAMYMVVDGKRYSDQCCFDYGNAETSGNDDGNGTMEAMYWGSDITWGGKGEGNGPWIAADLENGMFKSNQGGWQTTSTSPNDKSVIAPFATAMLKGPSGNHFTLKAANAQSGALTTMWDGVRPSPGYSPKKLQAAIILGTGGDGSNGGTGTFFEGAMTSGNPSDATDAAIQANIVAAGYGH
jgi:non-reducing end alpha-L-arabinofuranosidase